MNTIDLHEILRFGTALLTEAGKRTIPYFKRYQEGNTEISYKKDNSPVTEADTSTEQWIRTQLHESYPTFEIKGEEFGQHSTGPSRYKWIIDPIDGTRAFVSGVPLYTNLLALMDNKRNVPIAGFINAPITQELICAAEGLGAWYNKKKVRIDQSKVAIDIHNSRVLSYDFGALYKKHQRIASYLLTHAEHTRTWADGYAYLLTATSRADLVIDPNMHLWDLAPVYRVIVEAGAIISDFNGNAIDWQQHTNSTLTASNPTLHQHILDHIS